MGVPFTSTQMGAEAGGEMTGNLGSFGSHCDLWLGKSSSARPRLPCCESARLILSSASAIKRKMLFSRGLSVLGGKVIHLRNEVVPSCVAAEAEELDGPTEWLCGYVGAAFVHACFVPGVHERDDREGRCIGVILRQVLWMKVIAAGQCRAAGIALPHGQVRRTSTDRRPRRAWRHLTQCWQCFPQ